jgi:hypothetical protein
LDEEERQKEVEAVENEEKHIEDQPDGAPTAKSKNSTLENVSSRKFKRKQRNEIEETEFKLLNEMTKRLAQKENASRKEDDEDKLFLLSFVKEIKKITEDNKLDAKSEIIQTIKNGRKPRSRHICISVQTMETADISLYYQQYILLVSSLTKVFILVTRHCKNFMLEL